MSYGYIVTNFRKDFMKIKYKSQTERSDTEYNIVTAFKIVAQSLADGGINPECKRQLDCLNTLKDICYAEE